MDLTTLLILAMVFWLVNDIRKHYAKRRADERERLAEGIAALSRYRFSLLGTPSRAVPIDELIEASATATVFMDLDTLQVSHEWMKTDSEESKQALIQKVDLLISRLRSRLEKLQPMRWL